MGRGSFVSRSHPYRLLMGPSSSFKLGTGSAQSYQIWCALSAISTDKQGWGRKGFWERQSCCNLFNPCTVAKRHALGLEHILTPRYGALTALWLACHFLWENPCTSLNVCFLILPKYMLGLHDYCIHCWLGKSWVLYLIYKRAVKGLPPFISCRARPAGHRAPTHTIEADLLISFLCE